jgi:Flp pilus assembly protein TadD
MKTTTVSLACLCLCHQLTIPLSAQTPPDISGQSANPQAASLADAANTKLHQASSQQDYQQAADLLTKAERLDPKNPDIRKTLGWVYLDKLHRPHEAYPVLAPVAAAHTTDVDILKLYGMACAQTGRLNRAVAAFRRASALKPDDLWIRANLARNLARLGHYHQAEKIYAEILKIEPNNIDARFGLAEIAAWRGRSAGPLDSLQGILKDDPAYADALVLEGDINRWNWDFSQARADYKQALQTVPDDTDATKGLNAADQQADSSLTLKGYYFKDSTLFTRYSAGVDSRVYLADKAYLIVGADGWRFTNPGFHNLDSIVGHGGIEYDFNRYVQVTAEGTGFDYDHRDPIPGARLSLKVTPFHGLDIYTVGSYQDPFTTSMPATVEAIKQSSVGNGIDWKIVGPLSFQNSVSVASLSDYNSWWEEKPQLSWHLLSVPSIDIRGQFDHLSYSQYRNNYWSPNDWNTASPVLDISVPVCRQVHLNLDGQMPFVFIEDRFGYIGTGGFTIDITRWCQFTASYIFARIPGTLGPNSVPWSGNGGQASLVFRF